jgi:hypothetical protein
MTDGLEILQQAQEAERLLSSSLVQDVLGELRDEAMRDAIGGAGAEQREQARQAVLAIDGLQSRLRARVDAGRMQQHRGDLRERARAVSW